MFLLHRKALAAIGVTAAAVASTALFAMPAQAAAAGFAQVVNDPTDHRKQWVQFNALKGKTNGLVITISGRTVTLNDKVAIRAGKGCKAVKGDKTKVKCTTRKKTKDLNISLGDKNDWVINRTAVRMTADAGAGNDTITGGSGVDDANGGAGNDKLYGKGGNDFLGGGAGDDRIFGDAGADFLAGDAGTDNIFGGDGGDDIFAGAGNDRAYGDAGEDTIFGDAGNDVIFGGVWDDLLVGNAGDDRIYGEAGADFMFGETVDKDRGHIGSDSALDVLDGGLHRDLCAVLAAGTTVNCELTDSAASLQLPESRAAAAAVRAQAVAKLRMNAAAKAS